MTIKEEVNADDATKSIFRPEHDEIAANLVGHSLQLKENSKRMQALLQEDTRTLADSERLLDENEGQFSGHTRSLAEQAKGGAWSFWRYMVLLIAAFGIFIFMYLLIRLT